MSQQGAPFAGQVNEDGLADVLREFHIAVSLAEGGRIDGGQVALHKFREGILGAGLDVLTQEFSIVRHSSFTLYSRRIENRTENPQRGPTFMPCRGAGPGGIKALYRVRSRKGGCVDVVNRPSRACL